MPRKPGWVCITINGQTHRKLKKAADEKDEDLQILADQLLQKALDAEVPVNG